LTATTTAIDAHEARGGKPLVVDCRVDFDEPDTCIIDAGFEESLKKPKGLMLMRVSRSAKQESHKNLEMDGTFI